MKPMIYEGSYFNTAHIIMTGQYGFPDTALCGQTFAEPLESLDKGSGAFGCSQCSITWSNMVDFLMRNA